MFVFSRQENEIIMEREKRVRQLEQQLSMLEERMERHLSGEEKIPDDRLSSLKKRIYQYEDQLADFSRPLAPEVRETLRVPERPVAFGRLLMLLVFRFTGTC